MLNINKLRENRVGCFTQVVLNQQDITIFKNTKKNIDLYAQSVILVFMKTIDVTPSWQATVSILVEILQSPKAGHACKQNAVAELKRLAKFVDDLKKEG